MLIPNHFELIHEQRRKPVMRTKLKNLMNGNVMEKTFIAGESFEVADVGRKTIQFL